MGGKKPQGMVVGLGHFGGTWWEAQLPIYWAASLAFFSHFGPGGILSNMHHFQPASIAQLRVEADGLAGKPGGCREVAANGVAVDFDDMSGGFIGVATVGVTEWAMRAPISSSSGSMTVGCTPMVESRRFMTWHMQQEGWLKMMTGSLEMLMASGEVVVGVSFRRTPPSVNIRKRRTSCITGEEAEEEELEKEEKSREMGGSGIGGMKMGI